jgi:hypothetical protein
LNQGLVPGNQGLVTSNQGLVTGNQGLVTGNQGLVTSNQGLVTSNQGLVTGNQGLVTSNQGLVTGNQGLVTSNQGLVTGNQGLVTSAWGFGAGYLPRPQALFLRVGIRQVLAAAVSGRRPVHPRRAESGAPYSRCGRAGQRTAPPRVFSLPPARAGAAKRFVGSNRGVPFLGSLKYLHRMTIAIATSGVL